MKSRLSLPAYSHYAWPALSLHEPVLMHSHVESWTRELSQKKKQPASTLPSLKWFAALREEGSGNTVDEFGFFQQVSAYCSLNMCVIATWESTSRKYILLSLELLALLLETEVAMWYSECTVSAVLHLRQLWSFHHCTTSPSVHYRWE